MTRVIGRNLASLLAAAVLTVGCGAPSPAGPDRSGADEPSRTPSTQETPAAAARPLAVGENAWVAVSVATLWRAPTAPRPIDAPALANPARIAEWLGAMTTDERRALNGRADTQALLGDRVVVLRLRRHWARVVVPDQPTPDDSRGYPGWVPRNQLTATGPDQTATVATVVSRLAWLKADQDGGGRILQVSFGTTLPVLGRAGRFVRVSTPSGLPLRVRTGLVSVHDPDAPALAATRASVVSTATGFVGLDYLWAGRSGFGFDCSGLTSLVYRVHGLTLPRDAAPQSRAGRRVTSRLLKGDLMFYATDGVVHHVSMYAGNGTMVHSPRTGSTVQVIATSTPAYAAEYVGARRFLG